METPTLEQVKKYFKNAKEVREKDYNKTFVIDWNNVWFSDFKNWCTEDEENTHYLWSKTKGYAEIISYKEEQFETPKHYDNSKGTLYKVATERGWNPYLFDIVKRLERAEKKGEFKTDLEKSINVIKLWLNESE